MNLYLLRHAIAFEHDARRFPDDRLRPLTPEGRRKLRRCAEGLRSAGFKFDWIFTSPYVRARQTTDVVVKVFHGKKKVRISSELGHAGDTRKLVSELNKVCGAEDDVLLVGHEPDMSRFIAVLLTGDTKCSMELKKAGLCKLEAQPLKHGRCATLHLLLTPKVMMKLG